MDRLTCALEPATDAHRGSVRSLGRIMEYFLVEEERLCGT